MSSRTVSFILVVALLLAGCVHRAPRSGAADGAAGVRTVTGITWMWVRTVSPVEVIAPDAPEHYTLLLGDHGRAVVRADCNRGTGDYKLEGQKLELGPLALTRMMCLAGSQGDRYARQLGAAAHLFWRDDTLMIDLTADSDTMRFVRAH